MGPGKLAGFASGVAVLVLCAASSLHAQTVTFSEANDAVPGRFFDARSTAADPVNPNKLIIGFNSGLDPRTWKLNDFRASTAAFTHGTAMDTITVRIQAPEGFYISRITYSQRGSGAVLRTGKAAGGGSWVVDDFSDDLGTFTSNPTLSRTLDLTGQNKTFLPVSITSGLFAFSTPALGAAHVVITGADLTVELLPLVVQ
jgi:hypothetical protein